VTRIGPGAAAAGVGSLHEERGCPVVLGLFLTRGDHRRARTVFVGQAAVAPAPGPKIKHTAVSGV
jgi:hypothetical protein